jgi:hypothetical protein
MRWQLKEVLPKPYWRPGFAWLPVQAEQGQAGPNVWVWLEPIGIHTEAWFCIGGAGISTRRCTKEMMEEENARLSDG